MVDMSRGIFRMGCIPVLLMPDDKHGLLATADIRERVGTDKPDDLSLGCRRHQFLQRKHWVLYLGSF